MLTQDHATPRPYPAGGPPPGQARRPTGASALEAKALASARLSARRRRIRRIRTTVVAIATALFLALWAVIFTELVTGHDPALAASSAKSAATNATVASTAGTARTSGSTGSGSGSTSSGSGSTSSSSSASTGSTTTAVTTSQS